MSGPDRKEVVFQATAVDNNKHHYAMLTFLVIMPILPVYMTY
jgi:hypothetical protein